MTDQDRPGTYLFRGASSDSAEEPSTDRPAIAVATARQCSNGHEMPESHVFCSVCGSGRSEVRPDVSAPGKPMDPIGYWASQHIAIVVAASIIVVVGVVGGIGIAASGGSTPSNSPYSGYGYTANQQAYLNQLNANSGQSDFNYVGYDQLLSLGKLACTLLNKYGNSDVVYQGVEANAIGAASNLNDSDIEELVSAASDNLC